jgi:N-acetylmuramic acid 6-phosphate (MurNAc-6-P) etherase
VCAAVPASLAVAKAIAMSRRSGRLGAAKLLQAVAVAFTYDLARALALLAGGTHAARRSAEQLQDVTASSRS